MSRPADAEPCSRWDDNHKDKEGAVIMLCPPIFVFRDRVVSVES